MHSDLESEFNGFARVHDARTGPVPVGIDQVSGTGARLEP